MPRSFCHICGTVTADLYDNKCRKCFAKETSFLRLPKVSVRVCRECLRYFKKGRWTRTSGEFEEVIKKACRSALKELLRVEAKNPEVKIHLGEPAMVSGKVYRVRCKVSASGDVMGVTCEDELETDAKATLEMCTHCSRKAGGYFEAILQLRGRKDIATAGPEEIFDMLSREQRDSISNVKKLKVGTDLYFTSTQVCRKAAKMLMDRYGGSIKESAHLQGRDKSGKDFYRVSISLRLPDFKENDVVKLEGRTYQVLGFSSGRGSLFDLETRRRRSVPSRSMENAEKVEGRLTGAIVLEAIPGRIQVMEGENYKTLEFYLDLSLRPKDEVTIFKNNGIFLLKTGAESQ